MPDSNASAFSNANNIAILQGFTKEIHVDIGDTTLYLLVKPDQYLDGAFKAWCMDEQEFVTVRGWFITDIHESETVNHALSHTYRDFLTAK